MALVQANNNQDVEYTIKPQAVVPNVDTSHWPLLLKNYDRCAYLETQSRL